MSCEYEIHLTFNTYQTKQTDIIKQWQLIMVSLQLKPDIILGLGEITLLKSVTNGTILKQQENKYSAVGLFGAPKDLSWIKKCWPDKTTVLFISEWRTIHSE